MFFVSSDAKGISKSVITATELTIEDQYLRKCW